jgi:glycosyltransferase involved in cell wall biosynthesis
VRPSADRPVSIVVVERDLAPSRVPMYRTLGQSLACPVLVIVDAESDSLRDWGDLSIDGLEWRTGGPRTVVRTVLRRRPTHLIIGGWDRPSRWAALVAGRLAGAERLMLLGSWKPAGRSAPWARALSHTRARTALALSDGVLAYGSRAADYGRSLGASRVGVFGNSTCLPDRMRAQPAGGDRSGPFRIVAVGRLLPEKRFDLLIAALAELPGCELTIVGDGPERAALEGIAAVHDLSRRVRFTGLLDRPRALDTVCRADLLCLPSDYEPWGLCVNEAMMLGTMVACSRHVGAVGDLVKHRTTGFVVAAATPAAWRDAIAAAAATTAPARSALIERAAKRAAEFTPERAGRRIARFISAGADIEADAS